MKQLRIQSLYLRIFAIFWLTLLLVLIAVLVAQHSDPRLMRPLTAISNENYNALALKVEEKIKRQPTLIAGLENALATRQKKDKYKLYFTTISGDILLASQKDRRVLRNFSSQSDDIAAPKQRLYGRFLMAGPFLISHGKEQALMYTGKHWNDPPPFYIEFLDRPFQLLLVTMLVSSPLLLWLAWVVTSPARRLQRAAERVAKGHFEADATLEHGPREFRQAGASFNQMVVAINQMISGQQRLLSDISHELRSPLTRLRMANALAIRKQGESAELTRINTEADRMEQMISNLLSLSHMQSDSHTDRDSYFINKLWRPLLQDAEFEASQLNKVLGYSPLPKVKIIGNGFLLCSALENVVRNAIKYAKHNIDVDITCTTTQLSVRVSDDGDGVPAESLVDIFRPFYRVSSARDRQSGGTGLGLAITDCAMRQHHGSASASINSSGGLTIELVFQLQDY